MKSFFKTYSYDMVKMFLNQFATAVFGFALALAAGKAENPILRNVTSVFAILFYLFLLYTMTWDIGFREKVSVESGKKKRNAMTGVLISLCANAINFLFAIFISLAMLFNSSSFFGNIGAVCKVGALLLEGMYTGLLAHPIAPNVALNSQWWIWFLTPIPAILTCGIAYNMGLRDFKLTALLGLSKGNKNTKN